MNPDPHDDYTDWPPTDRARSPWTWAGAVGTALFLVFCLAFLLGWTANAAIHGKLNPLLYPPEPAICEQPLREPSF